MSEDPLATMTLIRRIERLESLIKEYDALLSAVVHYTQHKGGEFWEELRQRARDEGIDLPKQKE
jgi:hypothetical protein